MSVMKLILKAAFSSTGIYILSRWQMDEQKLLRVGANSPHALTNRLNQRFSAGLATA
jgi:hypothetical protein